MKRIVLAALLVLPTPAAAQPTQTYTVDLTERTDDRFHVVLELDGLTADHDAYQFPATIPGTYQIMDVGRFVEGFRALDGDGNDVPVEKVGTNRWSIGDPASVRTITFDVAETFDTPVDEHPIYPMAGSSIEADHVLLNPGVVFGYLEGLQSAPVRLRIVRPDGWPIGTALPSDGEAYLAESFDHLVDSPILTGEITEARTEIEGAGIEVYAYSASGQIVADSLLGAMRPILEASARFLGDSLPTDHYVFLYHFEGRTEPGRPFGALEHRKSSTYTLPDVPWIPQVAALVGDIAAHEFLHIVTPLNLHSPVIETFDFVEPTPSRHLWLYEGVTEWASHKSQLMAGVKPLEEYFQETMQKIQNAKNYDETMSLERLALTTYEPEGQAQFPNVYQKGAVVAGLLDIRLLDLSDGEEDLRTLILDLLDRYGEDRPFPEEEFYEVIEEMTYPEVGDFFDRYVTGAEPLPIDETYGTIGIRVVRDEQGAPVRFEVIEDASERQERLRRAWLGREALFEG